MCPGTSMIWCVCWALGHPLPEEGGRDRPPPQEGLSHLPSHTLTNRAPAPSLHSPTACCVCGLSQVIAHFKPQGSYSWREVWIKCHSHASLANIKKAKGSEGCLYKLQQEAYSAHLPLVKFHSKQHGPNNQHASCNPLQRAIRFTRCTKIKFCNGDFIAKKREGRMEGQKEKGRKHRNALNVYQLRNIKQATYTW